MERQEKHQRLKSDWRSLSGDPEMEILARLPVKSLLSCRRVCKEWRCLIALNSFARFHRKRHTSSPPLVLVFRNAHKFNCNRLVLTAFDLHGNVVKKYYLTFAAYYPTTILNCSFESKLMCFCQYDAKRFYSFNPSTRQSFRLPNPPCFSLPDITFHGSCFGYFPSKELYKLVHLVKYSPPGTMFGMILTFSISDNNNFQLNYNGWRSIQFEVTSMFKGVHNGLFARGAFYWMVKPENDSDCILCLDVETEIFSTFGIPPAMEHAYLMEIKDDLLLINETTSPQTLCMWKLSSDVNNHWTFYQKISFQSLGFIEHVPLSEFDRRILIIRFEYLQYYNLYPDQLCRMREMLKLEKGDDDLISQHVEVHNNLFTL